MKNGWEKSTKGINAVTEEITTANPDKAGYMNPVSFH